MSKYCTAQMPHFWKKSALMNDDKRNTIGRSRLAGKVYAYFFNLKVNQKPVIRSPELGEQTTSLKASSRKSVNFRKIGINQPRKKNLEEIHARGTTATPAPPPLPYRGLNLTMDWPPPQPEPELAPTIRRKFSSDTKSNVCHFRN